LDEYLSRRKGSTPKSFLNVDFSFLKFSSDGGSPSVSVTESRVYEREKKPSLLSVFLARFRTSKDKAEALEDAEDMSPEIAEEVADVEDEIEHIEEDVQELEEKREGLLTRLFSLFRRAKIDDEVDIEPEQEVELDENELLIKETREALRMIHHWVSKLPPEQINAFKRSPDFQKYKTILDKYGLIK
jgi:hypothetical protein